MRGSHCGTFVSSALSPCFLWCWEPGVVLGLYFPTGSASLAWWSSGPALPEGQVLDEGSAPRPGFPQAPAQAGRQHPGCHISRSHRRSPCSLQSCRRCLPQGLPRLPLPTLAGAGRGPTGGPYPVELEAGVGGSQHVNSDRCKAKQGEFGMQEAWEQSSCNVSVRHKKKQGLCCQSK